MNLPLREGQGPQAQGLRNSQNKGKGTGLEGPSGVGVGGGGGVRTPALGAEAGPAAKTRPGAAEHLESQLSARSAPPPLSAGGLAAETAL